MIEACDAVLNIETDVYFHHRSLPKNFVVDKKFVFYLFFSQSMEGTAFDGLA